MDRTTDEHVDKLIPIFPPPHIYTRWGGGEEYKKKKTNRRRESWSMPTDDRCQYDAGKPQTASSAPPLLLQSLVPVHLGCSP